MDTNLVKISGTIIRIYKNDRYVQIRLITDGNGNNKNFPTIFSFSDADGFNIASKFKEKDRITVLGHIQTRRGVHGSTIVAADIQPTPSSMATAFNLPGISYAEDINHVNLAGEIVHIFHPNATTSIISLRTVTDGHYAFPEVSLFGRLSKMAHDFKVGDRIAIIGTIQTKKEELADGFKYHEDVVARDIARIEV